MKRKTKSTSQAARTKFVCDVCKREFDFVRVQGFHESPDTIVIPHCTSCYKAVQFRSEIFYLELKKTILTATRMFVETEEDHASPFLQELNRRLCLLAKHYSPEDIPQS